MKSHQDCIIKKSKNFDFVHFWCGGTSRDEIYSHQFFLLSDPYFGFYSRSKFRHFWGTRILEKLYLIIQWKNYYKFGII